tara:strand:+ start:208 stop:369 length:162 start_codon:yes stop_codon:yes gene_type:complete
MDNRYGHLKREKQIIDQYLNQILDKLFLFMKKTFISINCRNNIRACFQEDKVA